ncbi:response regulator receiver domain protein [Bacteriovorax sp. BSW11_IV]|uniref:response regulator n=1 Tax=Bacteriovorax sp. BSW11_IV TaxID=1353529 RepID=UPI00038A2ABC|nr:response regulator [Bacteriovorax sp. BSW11_IV]EQC44990.1 response regulator receiver domain protein [Bacteriovorax sp. BSW11_IV]
MTTKRILIVDDEESIKLLYDRMFRREISSEQYELYFSLSGEDALEKIKNDAIKDITLVISDINMPGLSGFELLKELKEFKPDLPIFMSSAYTDQDRQNLAMELGALEYITKPVDFALLKEKIKKIYSI